MNQLTQSARQVPGVDGVVYISGFNLLTGQAVSYNGTAFIRLKPWDDRGSTQSAAALVGTLTGRLNQQIKDASVLVVNPPPIRGLGTAGGFTFVLQDRTGGDVGRFSRALQDLITEARKHPEIGFVYSGFDPRVPQIEFQVNRDKVKTLGVSLSDVFFMLQTFLGGYYINDFNLYGRTYRVQTQAEGSQRTAPEDIDKFYVRSTASGGMVPLSTVVQIHSINGPQYLERFNVYRAATINGTNAPGYSSGQAIDAMEQATRALPEGFSYEWSEATYQEKKTSGQTGYIFALSLIFVFLVLAALYESWAMPVAILLVIPFGVVGAFLGLLMRGFDNNVYTQIGLIMLIGLAAKNAILIVEFAKLARDRGTPAVQAAMEGARLRLRPILMTSFAFILGSVPLAVATGAGAGARQAIGVAVVFGMLVATLIGIFYIPAFYVMLQRLSERRSPFRPDPAPVQGGPGAAPAPSPSAPER